MKKLFVLMFMTIFLIGIASATNLTILSGTTSLGGNLTYDFVYVAAGATLQVDATMYLNITATQYINISGTVNGFGLGQAGGVGATAESGSGTNGSITKSGGGWGGAGGGICSGGSGGGSYATGGASGSETVGLRYAGGISYASGTDMKFYIGSGGGGGGAEGVNDGTSGGAGGGAISLKAPIIFINGTINVSANQGVDGGISNTCGGAGGGAGTILLIGRNINISYSNIQSIGGTGGSDGTGGAYGSGGGGSGGVIKMFYIKGLYNTSLTTSVLGGNAGGGSYLGTAGGNGVVYLAQQLDLGFSPEVTLNNPAINNISIIPTIIFNCSASDDIKVQNVSLYINNSLEETNTSGINNVNYIFTKSLEYGFYNWTCGVCNNATNPLCNNATVRNLTIFPVIVNSNTFNSSTYETSSEVFSLNLTANSSLTAVSLNYNGTLYPMTNSGGVWSKTLSITSTMVGTQSFNYKYTYGGNTFYSDNSTQTVTSLLFANCNATYNTQFVNYTFKDESSLGTINATIPLANFYYWIGDSTLNKTLTYTNTSLNYSFSFCSNAVNSTLHVVPYVQYKQGTAYPQRVYQSSVLHLTNTTTNTTLYLLAVADGIYVTFQVTNPSNQVLSGVTVNASREIGGSDV